MQICHSDVDTFRKSVGSTRSARYQNDNCRRLFSFRDGDNPDVLILYISAHFTGVTGRSSSCRLWMFQISTMASLLASSPVSLAQIARSREARFACPNRRACSQATLWPTLRPKFMNFWSFLTRPGDKHDENISNCSSTPKRSWPKLTILPWVSRCFNFSLDKTPNLMVFSEMSFWNEIFLCSITTEMFTVAESLACVQALHLGDIVKSTRTNGTGEEMRERGKGERSAARFARPNRRACSQATESQVILSRKRRDRKLQETSQRFCETLVGHTFFKVDEMS